MDKFKSNETFPRMFLMENREPGEHDVIPIRVYTSWEPPLFSSLHSTPGYNGPVLGIAFDKTPEHASIIAKLSYHRIS